MDINKDAQLQINLIEEKCKLMHPLVVISCLTFNHEAYIREALEGFVRQQTDFPFVAIVHDDASTDQTAAIIREYANNFPNIILPILEKENQYSKRDDSLTKIMELALKRTGASYLALCEGDDYWTNPLKLQKQINFLESHSEYSMCFHKVEVKYEKGVKIKKIPFQHLEDRDYSASDIMENWTVPTCSAILRTQTYNKIPKNQKFQFGDNVLWLTCARDGKIRCLPETMSVYRRQPKGYTSQKSSDLQGRFAQHTIGLIESFPDQKLSKVLIAKFNHQWFLWFLYDIKNHFFPKTTLNFAFKNWKYIKFYNLINESKKAMLYISKSITKNNVNKH